MFPSGGNAATNLPITIKDAEICNEASVSLTTLLPTSNSALVRVPTIPERRTSTRMRAPQSHTIPVYFAHQNPDTDKINQRWYFSGCALAILLLFWLPVSISAIFFGLKFVQESPHVCQILSTFSVASGMMGVCTVSVMFVEDTCSFFKPKSQEPSAMLMSLRIFSMLVLAFAILLDLFLVFRGSFLIYLEAGDCNGHLAVYLKVYLYLLVIEAISGLFFFCEKVVLFST